MVEEAFVVKLGARDCLLIAILAIALAAVAVLQAELALSPKRESYRSFSLDLPGFVALNSAIWILHELLHIASLKSLGAEVLGVKIARIARVPVALIVLYGRTSVRKYLLAALAPQSVSAALFLSALTADAVVDLLVYRGPLHVLLYLLYAVHLPASAGDFYGVAYLLAKARTLRGYLECVVEDGRLEGVRVVVKR